VKKFTESPTRRGVLCRAPGRGGEVSALSKKVPQARVVVVGAGFGGLMAARELSRCPNLQVTVLDRTNHHLFQPLLYQVASAALNTGEIASPIRALLRGRPNVRVIMGSMTGVDYDRREVIVDDDSLRLPYDYLVLAMGGRTSYFGHEAEWQDLACGLKTLADALEIRARVLLAFERAERETDPEVRKKLMTLVVVGGGPTGVELAGAFAELRLHVLRWDFRNIDPESARIVLLEAGGRLLGQFPARLGEYARERLARMGVEVRLNERVLEIGPGFVRTDKELIEAGNVLWAAGVAGHELASKLGHEVDRANRLLVRPDLRLPGRDEVYCIGDAARFEEDGQPLPGLAPVAMQQGRHAARNIKRQLQGKPTLPFKYFDRGTMATIGRSAAIADIRGKIQLKGLPAWLAWLFIHLMFIVEFQNRVLILIRWAWAYFTWKWGVRLITQPPRRAPEVSPGPRPGAGANTGGGPSG
jgi:NADH dehydrogenase